MTFTCFCDKIKNTNTLCFDVASGSTFKSRHNENIKVCVEKCKSYKYNKMNLCLIAIKDDLKHESYNSIKTHENEINLIACPESQYYENGSYIKTKILNVYTTKI